MMLTDHEIAKQASTRPIKDIAAKLGVDDADLLPYGDEIAKVSLGALNRPRNRPAKPRLVLVSATTPTAAGEGKTTTSIGLAQAMDSLGESVCLALREPSLGPCFGVILTGNIMRMPGLPKRPKAEQVELLPDGTIVGVG